MPHLLQITIFVEQQRGEDPSHRLHLCCSAGRIPKEGEFQGPTMSIIEIKVICLVLCKVFVEILSWDSLFVHPCYFQIRIYEIQKFKAVAVLHHLKAMAALNPTKKGYESQAGSFPTLLL